MTLMTASGAWPTISTLVGGTVRERREARPLVWLWRGGKGVRSGNIRVQDKDTGEPVRYGGVWEGRVRIKRVGSGRSEWAKKIKKKEKRTVYLRYRQMFSCSYSEVRESEDKGELSVQQERTRRGRRG